MRIQSVNNQQNNNRQNFNGYRLTTGLPREISSLQKCIPSKYKSMAVPIDGIFKGDNILHTALVSTGYKDTWDLDIACTMLELFGHHDETYAKQLENLLKDKVDFKQTPQPIKEMIAEMKDPKYDFEQIKLDTQA